MKPTTTFLKGGIARSAAYCFLAIAAVLALSAVSPAVADAQAASGSIRVCHVIVRADGTAATSSAGLPAGTFSVVIGHQSDRTSPTTTLETASFSAATFAPNAKLLAGSTGNDAMCVTPVKLTGLAFTSHYVSGLDRNFSSYVYAPATVSGSGWNATKYNDQATASVTSTSTFYIYGANTDSDGYIEIGTSTPSRTLVLMNSIAGTTTAPSNPSNGSGGSGSGGGRRGGGSSSLSISNEDVEEVVSGFALVTWDTNRDATSQVVYGTESISDSDIDEDDDEDNFGYPSATIELEDEVREHSMAVGGLRDGVTYYFRPVSTRDGRTVVGDEVALTVGGNGGNSGNNNGGNGSGQACTYLNDFLKRTWNNDPDEVRKLQTFLRDEVGYSFLQVTGTFDEATYWAVRAFQEKYHEDILAHWGHDDATGFVYILTKKKVNEIYCDTTIALTAAEEQEIREFRAYMDGIKSGRGPSGGTIDGGSVAGPVGPGTAGRPSTPTTTPGTEGPVIIDETGGGQVATGTTWLDRGTLGNLAAAVFTLPENGTEFTRCIFNLIIILAIIYIITSILVSGDEGTEADRARVRTRKLMFFMAGAIIATAFALFFDMFCLVAPLLLAIIILVILLILNRMRGRGPKQGSGPTPTAPVLVEQQKVDKQTASTTTPAASAPAAAPAAK